MPLASQTALEFFACPTTIAAIAVGVLTPTILENAGLLVGQAGVAYYAEIHTTPLNAFCHTAGMPVVAYGSLIAIPMCVRAGVTSYLLIQRSLYVAYMTHYIVISWKVGLLTSAVYLVPLVLAQQHTYEVFRTWNGRPKLLGSKTNEVHQMARMYLLIYGVLVTGGALTLQEGLGHHLSGDPYSRLEGVLNAVMYAIYFSTSHISQYFV